MMGPRNLRPDELGDAEGMELHDAIEAGNRMVDALDDAPVRPSLDFTDRIMAALADEPTPGTAGFLVPLRRRGLLAGFRESVRQARAAMGAGRPLLARSAALAYVLAVAIAGVSLSGAAAVGAGAVLGLFDGDRSPTPAPTFAPAPTPAPTVAPEPTIAPTLPSSEPPTIRPTPTPSPSETPDESDDHGGNSGPGGGGGGDDDDDSSGPGSGGDDDSSGPGSGGSDDHGGNRGPGSGDDD